MMANDPSRRCGKVTTVRVCERDLQRNGVARSVIGRRSHVQYDAQITGSKGPFWEVVSSDQPEFATQSSTAIPVVQ